MIIRYKRMQGYDALWLPGMDHAGEHNNQGISGYDLGREGFLKKAWVLERICQLFVANGLSLD